MENKLFNSVFEMQLRLLLLLNAGKRNWYSLGRLVSLDFIVCYAEEFQLPFKSPTPRVENAVRICFALHLPPAISEKLLEVLSCKLKPTDPNHQWIKEALYLKYPESYDAVCEWLLDYGVEL